MLLLDCCQGCWQRPPTTLRWQRALLQATLVAWMIRLLLLMMVLLLLLGQHTY
jgi:hypothetical protein